MKFPYDKIRKALPEVQTTLHWWVEFLGEANTDTEIVEKFKNDTQIRVTTTGLPVPEITHTEVQLQGRNLKYTGKVDKSGTITLTFVEGTDTKVLDAIYNWIDKYYDKEGKQKETEKLKLKIVLHLLDGADKDTIKFTLRGCLPSVEPGGELGQDANPLNPVLTITFEDHIYEGKNVSWGR